jgi:ribonuclease Z
MRRSRWLIALAAAVALAAGGIAFAIVQPGVQDAAFARGARTQLARKSQLPLDEGALRVLLCGTSSPLPVRRSAKACTLVAAGGQVFLVDIGPEATENLALWRVPAPRVSAVFLTHFHSDHIGELGEFNMQGWAQGRRQPLVVYGPEGIERVVAGFNEAYAFDRRYRNAHHDRGRGLLPLAAAEMQPRVIPLAKAGQAPSGRSMVVYDRGGVRVTAIETDHQPVTPAFAYRFDYQGRSVVITGDTTYYPPLAAAARGADVLVSEAQASHLQDIMAREADATGQTTLGQVLRDTRDYHISPVDAARLANEAGVRELVYTHLAPPMVTPWLETPWRRGVGAVRPRGVRVGRDGLLITIPVDGGKIGFQVLRG